MTTRRLLWGMTWRNGLWGLLAGLILGAIYGLVLIVILATIYIANQTSSLNGGEVAQLALLFTVIGAMLGTPTGVFAGTVNGFGIGILTRLFFTELKNVVAYRWAIAIISALLTSITAWLVPLAIILLIGEPLPFPSQLFLFVTIPAIIAGIVAAFLSQRLARWYERESAKGIMQNVSSN